MYDGILQMRMQEGVSLIGYADDIAVIVEDKNWEHAKEKTCRALRKIYTWQKENNLEMDPEKTEITVWKYGRRRRDGTIDVAGWEIEISQGIKYLGVYLDTSALFGPHIRTAAEMITKISKLMPNMRGPGEAKRKMLAAVVNSVMLYGSPIWAGDMSVRSCRALLQSIQRKAALRVLRGCSGYRFIDTDTPGRTREKRNMGSRPRRWRDSQKIKRKCYEGLATRMGHSKEWKMDEKTDTECGVLNGLQGTGLSEHIQQE